MTLPRSRLELLQAMPIFGAIGDAALDFLIDRARALALPRGARFFGEGEVGRSMFVLEAGTALVTRGWQGRQLFIRRFEPGDCFGEMALLDLSPRSATVTAESDCRALEFDSDDLYALYAHDVEPFALIQMNLAREMSRRLRVMDDRLFSAWMGEAAQYRSD